MIKSLKTTFRKNQYLAVILLFGIVLGGQQLYFNYFKASEVIAISSDRYVCKNSDRYKSFEFNGYITEVREDCTDMCRVRASNVFGLDAASTDIYFDLSDSPEKNKIQVEDDWLPHDDNGDLTNRTEKYLIEGEVIVDSGDCKLLADKIIPEEKVR